MDRARTRRVELLVPMRTLLVVAATIGVLAAFVAIGDTFLIVFVGIFLALVFEYPVRFVMRKTHMSRGLAATVTVIGSAILVTVLFILLLVPLVSSVRDFLKQLPQTVQELRDSGELSWLGDSGAAKNVQDGAQHISASIPDAVSSILGVAGGFFGVFLALFTILFICLFLLTDIGRLKESLGSVLMPGQAERNGLHVVGQLGRRPVARELVEARCRGLPAGGDDQVVAGQDGAAQLAPHRLAVKKPSGAVVGVDARDVTKRGLGR